MDTHPISVARRAALVADRVIRAWNHVPCEPSGLSAPRRPGAGGRCPVSHARRRVARVAKRATCARGRANRRGGRLVRPSARSWKRHQSVHIPRGSDKAGSSVAWVWRAIQQRVLIRSVGAGHPQLDATIEVACRPRPTVGRFPRRAPTRDDPSMDAAHGRREGRYGPPGTPQFQRGIGSAASAAAPGCELITARREPHSR